MDMSVVSVSDLPSVAVSHILAHLAWTEKLNAVDAIPAWYDHLCTTDAWPMLHYVETENSIIRDRQILRHCVRTYGQYMFIVKVDFYFHLGEQAAKIFHSISECCSLLKTLEISHAVWTSIPMQAYVRILNGCKNLSSILLKRPALAWEQKLPKENVITVTATHRHAHKLKVLTLSCDSLLHGFSHLLHLFTEVVNLRLRRDELEEAILLKLATECKLNQLTTFQEEEISSDDAMAYTDITWQNILKHKPTFSYNLLMKNVIVLRSSFPAHAPLKSLVLIDLAASLTKGILDTISDHYKSSLEVFVYTKQHHLHCNDLDDRRLPSALVDLVTNCSKLHTLVFGFDISSTTILMLASARKLANFILEEESILFDQDWSIQPNWTPEFINWLKYSGSSLYHLQSEVSAMLGYRWCPCSSNEMWHRASNAWYM